MNQRVDHRLSRERSSAPCSRCLSIIDVDAGTWHAADGDNLERSVCDDCARAADPAGFEQICAWRRMARPTRRTAA